MIKTVILSAYSISPVGNSEPGVAWKQFLEIINIDKYYFVLITRAKNKTAIDEYLTENNIDNVAVEGVDLPVFLMFWKKGHIAMHIYYYVWQFIAFWHAKKIQSNHNVVLAHHISFMTIRTGFISFLGVPSILGPVGGAQLPPKGFGKVLKRYKNLIRTLSILAMPYSPVWRAFIRKTDLILIANKSNQFIIPKKYHNKIRVMQIPWWGKEHYSRPTACKENTVNEVKIKLLWCSRLVKWKGLEVVLTAIRKMVVSRSFNNFELDIIGKGEDSAYFEELAQSLDISDVVFFRGYVTDEEKEVFFEDADVCLFSSLHETTGATLFEYLDYSKCTVVLDHAGPGEIGRATKCSMIDCSGGFESTVVSLERALYKLCCDSELREQTGSRSNSLFKEFYSPSSYIREIEKFYEKLISA